MAKEPSSGPHSISCAMGISGVRRGECRKKTGQGEETLG
jgi:hypothetical protein